LKIVVDTNIMFSYFWEKSLTKKILQIKKIDFFTPHYAIKELDKYKYEILKKAKITSFKFNKAKDELKKDITIIPIKTYINKFKNIKSIPDEKDIDFIALCLELKTVLWSNDNVLKNQNYVTIFNTKEILIILKKLGYYPLLFK